MSKISIVPFGFLPYSSASSQQLMIWDEPHREHIIVETQLTELPLFPPLPFPCAIQVCKAFALSAQEAVCLRSPVVAKHERRLVNSGAQGTLRASVGFWKRLHISKLRNRQPKEKRRACTFRSADLETKIGGRHPTFLFLRAVQGRGSLTKQIDRYMSI